MRNRTDTKEADAALELTLSYRKAAESKGFVAILERQYLECRRKASKAYELSEASAAYWAGRADTYENIIFNLNESRKITENDIRNV